MKRWMVIVLSVAVAAGSLQTPANAAITANTMIEAEDNNKENVDAPEDEDYEVLSGDEHFEEADTKEDTKEADEDTSVLQEEQEQDDPTYGAGPEAGATGSGRQQSPEFSSEEPTGSWEEPVACTEKPAAGSEESAGAKQNPANEAQPPGTDEQETLIEEKIDNSETADAAGDVILSGSCGDNVTYILNAEGTLTITGTGEIQDYYPDRSIPSYAPWKDKIDAVKQVIIEDGITAIGRYALANCTNLTEITIPSSVVSIRTDAFAGCNSLKSIDLPSSVTSIERYAFFGCSSLTSVEIPSGVTVIEYGTFINCTGLTEVKISSGTTSINNFAFENCSSLTSVEIPPSVKSIGTGAFSGCSSLQDVEIPPSVTLIEEEIFKGCSSLTYAIIPASVIWIGEDAFWRCSRLTDIYFGGDEDTWESVIKGRNAIPSSTIIHCGIHITASLRETDLEQDYTGSEIRPVPIVKNTDGKILTEGKDYSLSYENNIEPGTGKVLVSGTGEYKGQTVSVEFTINPAVDAEEAGPMLRGYTAALSAVVVSKTEVSPDGVSFEVKSAGADILEWGEASVEALENDHYRVMKSVRIKEPGKYDFEASFNGHSDTAAFEVLDYETSVELGPRLVDETIASKNQDRIKSYCDVRFVIRLKGVEAVSPDQGTSSAKASDQGASGTNASDQGAPDRESPFAKMLSAALEQVTYNDAEMKDVFRICSEKTSVGRDQTWGEKIIRVVPVGYAAKDVKLVFEEENGDSLQKTVKAGYGITEELAFRSDIENNGKTSSYNNFHTFSLLDDYFYKGAYRYNNDLAVMTLGMAMSAFSNPSQDDAYWEHGIPRSGNIVKAYSMLSFEEDSVALFKYDVALDDSNDTAAYSMAARYISSKESDDTLIAVVVRGGGYGGEWASNFHVGDEDDSEGFREPARIIVRNLETYLTRLNEKGKIVGGVKIWITGFSRSAAIANLVSHSVNQAGTISGVEVLPDNIYTYAFATPGGHYGGQNSDDNIFNIISENDLVPRVPIRKWGFSRYGRNVVLPTITPEAVKLRFGDIAGMEFTASDQKSAEELIVNIFTVLAPSRRDYCNYIQDYIVGWEKFIFKIRKGNFLVGIGLGLATALYKDVSLVRSDSLFDLPNKIELIFGRGFRAVGAIYDTVKETDFDKINETGIVGDFAKVHFPEHYLAWLETGGSNEATDKPYDYLSDLDEEERKRISSRLEGYIDRESADTNFTLIEVDKAYKISVLDPDETVLASTVERIAHSGAGVSGTGATDVGATDANAGASGNVAGDGVSAFYSEEMNKALVVLEAGRDYSVRFYPTGSSGVTFSASECDEESVRRTVVYSSVEADESSAVTLTITGEGDTNEYEVTNADGSAAEPVYDSSSAGETHYDIKVTGGFSVPETARPGEVVHVYWDQNTDAAFKDWKLMSSGTVLADPSAAETYFIMPEKDVYIAAETDESAVLYFGTCGEDLYWTLNENGDLSITGSGKMTNYTLDVTGSAAYNPPPWLRYSSLVRKVFIGEGVTSIGRNAFNGCSALTGVMIPDGLESIGEIAFYKCSELEEIDLPQSIKAIYSSAFNRCTKLKSITIPEDLERIPDHMLAHCSSLTELELPAGIRYIGIGAFDGCSGLQSVTIPGDALVSIADEALTGCPNLRDIYYGHSNADWHALNLGINNRQQLLLNGTTIHCSDYYDITGSCGDAVGWSLSTEGVLTITGSGAMKDYTAYTISPWTYLPIRKVIIEEGVTSIGEWSFRGCYNLESVILPKGLTRCCSQAFYDCPGLETIVLPEGSEMIGSYSFRGCTNLRRILIPSSVTVIGDKAFSATVFNAEPKNLTIYGVKDSYAEQFAVEHGIAFSAVKPLSSNDVSVMISNQQYTGKALTPAPSVMDGDDMLTQGTDYTVYYENNINAGEATITITGIGFYTGAVTRTFLILPGKTTRGDMFNLANNVKVTWKEVPGARYYKVYRQGVTNSKESLDKPVIVTSGLVGWDKQPGLTNGHAYRYRIIASLTGAGDSGGDSTLSYSKLTYRLKTVVIRSVKNTAPGKVTVKYDKTASGDSYVLQYCERQDMVGAKTKVVLGASNTSYVIGGLKKGKTYYISIRVRKKVDGVDYYTTFGVAKKVTITQ